MIHLLDLQGCSSICNPHMTFRLARIDLIRLDKQRYVEQADNVIKHRTVR